MIRVRRLTLEVHAAKRVLTAAVTLGAIIDSLHFADGPVSNPAWAESLAWNELPPDIRVLEWPVAPQIGVRPQWGTRSVVVEQVASGYEVTFAEGASRAWKFAVSASGSFAPIRGSTSAIRSDVRSSTFEVRSLKFVS
jgi:hypothetical protein